MPAELRPLAEPLVEQDFLLTGEVFAKTLVLPEANTIVPQHSHKFDHVTVLVRGSAEVWIWQEAQYGLTAQWVPKGRNHAPASIFIPAHTLHKFMSLEPGTVLMCVHDARLGTGMDLVDGGKGPCEGGCAACGKGNPQ